MPVKLPSPTNEQDAFSTIPEPVSAPPTTSMLEVRPTSRRAFTASDLCRRSRVQDQANRHDEAKEHDGGAKEGRREALGRARADEAAEDCRPHHHHGRIQNRRADENEIQ